jgi:hypothetical protein
MTVAFIIRGVTILGRDGIVIPSTVVEIHYPDPGDFPSQLADPRINFVILRPHLRDDDGRWVGQKLPRYGGWQMKSIRHDDPRLASARIEGNVGVICRNGLVVVDQDQMDVLRDLGKSDLLPPTLAVKTGSGGFHYYFWAEFLQRKIVFNSPDGTHLGEVQCGDVFVVAPGSLHPNGQRYEVVEDLPIAELSEKALDSFMEGLSVNGSVWDPSAPERFSAPQKNTIPQRAEEDERLADCRREYTAKGTNLASRLQHIPIEAVIFPKEGKVESDDGNVAKGANLWHGSTNGHNLKVDRSRGTWTCFRCRTEDGGYVGGTIVEALFILYKRDNGEPDYDCSCHKKENIRGREFINFIPWARKWCLDRGFSFPTDDVIFSKKEPHPTVPTTSASEFAETLKTKFEDPGTSQVSVWGVPRIGKTHAAVKRLVEAEGGVSIAPTHNILAHQLRIFRDLGGRGAVHLKGKDRSCNRQVKKR